MPDYVRPTSLEAALDALAARRWTVLAGGTDFYPSRVGRPVTEDLLDVTALPELTGITEDAQGWRIGAAVRWAELLHEPLPALFDALKQASREVGGVQIQNAGTLAGNLCNASPAADGIPPLLAMDAAIELASVRGVRRLPLAEFVLGNRVTARAPDELVTTILVPRPAGAALSRFTKLGARRYLVISIVMLAIVVELDASGRIARAGVAVGAAGPRACRLPLLEARLTGERLGAALARLATPEVLAPLAPIDDIRASAAYRLDAALTLLRRSLLELAPPAVRAA